VKRNPLLFVLLLLLISITGNFWQWAKIRRQNQTIASSMQGLHGLKADLDKMAVDEKNAAQEEQANYERGQADFLKFKKQIDDRDAALVRLIDLYREELTDRNEVIKKLAQKTKSTTVPASYNNWVQIAHFQGTGQQRTASFQITGQAWRIRWHFIAPQKDIISVFTVMNEGASDDLLVNTSEPGEETSYGKGTGTFDLLIAALNSQWEIVVEQTNE
jgi:hypothetical protein